jgi:hypothetical protein
MVINIIHLIERGLGEHNKIYQSKITNDILFIFCNCVWTDNKFDKDNNVRVVGDIFIFTRYHLLFLYLFFYIYKFY